MRYPLMNNNNIDQEDVAELISFLENMPHLTAGKKVREFESQWSQWLGAPDSVMVNSGSSSNLVTLFALKEFTEKKTVIVPPLTWISDIVSIYMAGFKPKFIDINLNNLALDIDKVIDACDQDTACIFITHILGFNGLNQKLLDFVKMRGIFLLEDCCESYGATFQGEKIGTFGLASNFSFYFAHHLTTVEGGMITSSNEDFLEYCRLYRGHGLARELLSEEKKARYISLNSDLNKDFIFVKPGFNLRPNEMNAIFGLSQLKRLNKNIEVRNKNFRLFLELIDKNKFFTSFSLEGMSNYAFVLMTADDNSRVMDKVIQKLQEVGIEYRRGASGGGNQLRQPYLKGKYSWRIEDFPMVEHVHKNAVYIGNYPKLTSQDIEYIAKVINEA